MAVAVARCSRDLRYQWVSQGYTRWAERPIEEINGQPIAKVIGEEALETIRPYIERVLTGERVEYESLVNLQGRRKRWINAIYTPTYGETNTPDGWVAVIVDITDHKTQSPGNIRNVNWSERFIDVYNSENRMLKE